MQTSRHHHRRGMTLPELLVVVAIIGLLAVTVLPVLGGSQQRSRNREAADLVVGHLSHASAKAIGSRYGWSTWYETDSTGAGGDQAVFKLGFGRVRLGISGSATITPVAGSPTEGTLSPALASGLAAFLPTPIEFAGMPNLFVAASTTQITAVDSSLNRTGANNVLPQASGTPLPYTLKLPPRERMTASAAYMPNNMAIDFACSTIGVAGFGSSTPQTMSSLNIHCLAITFDRTGRADRAWYTTMHSGTGGWSCVTLNSSTPLALLVGPRGNVGNTYVTKPSDDDPGANWQNPDARWILVDPRSSVVRSIETYPSATSLGDSQKLVLATLRNVMPQ